MKINVRILSVLFVLFFGNQGLAKGHIIYTKKGSDSLVLFVHGWESDEREAWTNTSTDFFWPEHIADKDKDFAKYDVISYSYNSKCGAKLDISELATRLKVFIEKRLKKYKKIWIVAHSMGGLVTRKYLIKTNKRSPTGIILLSTPSLGRDTYVLKTLCGKQARDIDKVSKFTDELNEDWRNKYRDKNLSEDFYFKALYEKYKTHRILVVNKDSAIEMAHEAVPFEKDHYGIAKPENENDELYQVVKSYILDSSISVSMKNKQKKMESYIDDIYAIVDNSQFIKTLDFKDIKGVVFNYNPKKYPSYPGPLVNGLYDTLRADGKVNVSKEKFASGLNRSIKARAYSKEWDRLYGGRSFPSAKYRLDDKRSLDELKYHLTREEMLLKTSQTELKSIFRKLDRLTSH